MTTLKEQLDWFDPWKLSPEFDRLEKRPVAYFCAEYALDDRIPTYSGGLGVLAGDVVREAADRGVPMVAIGLYYRHGYACEITVLDGKPVETCEDIRPDPELLSPVMTATGERLIVRVPIQDRYVEVQVSKWTRGGVSVYLLDSNLESNSAADRRITDRLYIGDKETRFKQEIIIGIGGLRLLEALKIHPSVYHLNEGHSAMLGLELVRHEMQERQLGFDEAKQFARRRMVMTNHTLVAAGNEVYSDDLVALLLGKYSEELGVPVAELVKLGLVQETSVFSMTMLALRLTSVVNAVSKLHAEKAREIWHDHPMATVTNGIHLPTWDLVRADVKTPGTFWKIHLERKTALLAHVKTMTGRDWSPDALLLGWSRRIVSYKRPTAMLEDAERFAKIARDSKRPVRIVFGGRPHPSDQEGHELLERLRALIDGGLKDVAAFLPDYGLETAKLLVSGTDVWLNTPIVGFEACGTSGLKAALNGSLPCSTKDGWVAEAEMFKVGWLLDSAKISSDALDVLERDIVPSYYARDASGVPSQWEEMMRNSRAMIQNQFSATRMIKEYIETLYS